MSLNELGTKRLVLDSPLTLYVDGTNGSDANDGSQSRPFKQIQKAVHAMPPICTYNEGVIVVADGTYPENVNVPNIGTLNFYGGNVGLKNINTACCTVNLFFDSLTFFGDTPGEISGAAVAVLNQGRLRIVTDTFTVSDKYFVFDSEFDGNIFIQTSSAFTANNCHIINHSFAGANIISHLSGVAGAGNSIFYFTNSAFIEAWGEVGPGVADIVYYAANGGRIYMGGQTDAPYY
jgi:pectin methylesterase-like acyl-CoA thioesterase